MAEESATPAAAPAEEVKAEGESAAAAGAAAADSGENGENKENKGKGGRERRDRADEKPIEELYDLSQTIPHVPRPSKEAHEAEVAEVLAAIDAIKEERRKLQEKIDASMSSGKNPEANAAREAMFNLRNKKGALIEDKKALRARMDATRSAADKLHSDRKSARSAVRFNSVAEIDEEIRKLHRRQETTSMSLAEEKRLIKEIDALEASKKTVAELKTKETALGDAKEQRKAIQAELNAKDAEIDAVQKEIDERKAALDEINAKDAGNRAKLDELFAEREGLKKEMSAKFDQRNELRQKFREDNNKWYDYQRAVRKQKQMKYEEEKKAREAEREAWLKKKEEEEAKKIPYEEEMALCDYLADYLTRTYLADADAEKKKKEEEAARKKAADVVAVKDDPFANFKPVGKKKGDEEEVYLQMGKGKKKKRERASKKNKAAATSFTLSVDSFEQFGLLGLTPPTALTQVEKSVEELRAKKKWYSEQPRGSVKTAQEIRKENERNAARVRQQGASGEGGDGGGGADGKKKGGGAPNLTSDDFAPLGAAPTSAVNSTWGQKAEAPEEAAPEEAAPEEAAVESEAF